VQTFCGQGGRQKRTSALFGVKNGFFKIYGVSAQTRRVEPVRTFFGKEGEGQIFAILCGRALWSAPKKITIDCVKINKSSMACLHDQKKSGLLREPAFF